MQSGIQGDVSARDTMLKTKERAQAGEEVGPGMSPYLPTIAQLGPVSDSKAETHRYERSCPALCSQKGFACRQSPRTAQHRR